MPPKFKVPRCSCGAKREFEMQVLPSALLQLDVDEVAARDTSGGARPAVDDAAVGAGAGSGAGAGTDASRPPSDLVALLGSGGMDWGSIMVFSCEDSCDGSQEEFCVVVDPLA